MDDHVEINAADNMKSTFEPTDCKWDSSSNRGAGASMEGVEDSPGAWQGPSSSLPKDAIVQHPDRDKGKMIFSFTLLPSHVVVKKQRRSYKCDVCASTYRHAFSLKRHFLRNHVTVRYISKSDINNCKINVNNKKLADEQGCFDDGSSDSSSSTFDKAENKIVYGKDDDATMAGLYRCHLCKGCKFDSRNEIRSHFQTHLGSSKSQFPCEKCNVVFSHKQALYRHLTSHSEVASFPCTTCGKVFESKALCLKHALTHTDGRTCKYCNKILSTKANRIRHERIHEGLKPYPCKHCNVQFTQSGDLKKHVKKQHGISYLACTICTNLFSSRTSLNKHMADRHGDHSQASSRASSSHDESRASPAKERHPRKATNEPTSASPAQKENEPKSHHCPVCKKRYHSYVSMLQHKRVAHPFSSKTRKVHRKIKYYTRRQSLIYKQRHKELTEEEFFKALPNMISENLHCFVDGKAEQINADSYAFSEPEQPRVLSPQEWSAYNFPSSFDVDQVLRVKGQEIKSPAVGPIGVPGANHLNGNMLLQNDNDSDHVYDSCSSFDTSDSDISFYPVRMYVDYKNIDVEERKKLIGRSVNSVVLCSVCRESFPSRQEFLAHSANNHNNVLNSYVEIEGEKDLPPIVPRDMLHHFLSPDGVYFSCNVPPAVGERATMKCTKCTFVFSSSLDLHEHIIMCSGSDRKAAPVHVRKSISPRKIKRTMKKRYSSASLDRRLGKSKLLRVSPSVLSGATLPVFKPSVGRPKSNLSFLCPHCKRTFRTKPVLSHHMNRCYKRLVMKRRYMKVALKKTEALETGDPPRIPEVHNSAPEPTSSSSLAEVSVGSLDVAPSRIENSVERLSPSLEVLVNSIKEKLTAEELSPANPTFSWMEDDPFIVARTSPPAVTSEAKVDELNGQVNKPTSASDEKPNEDIDETAPIIDDPLEARVKICDSEVPPVASSELVALSIHHAADPKVGTPNLFALSSSEDNDLSARRDDASGGKDDAVSKLVGVKRKASTQKYKPRVNPYVKKRGRKRCKLGNAAAVRSAIVPDLSESAVLDDNEAPGTPDAPGSHPPRAVENSLSLGPVLPTSGTAPDESPLAKIKASVLANANAEARGPQPVASAGKVQRRNAKNGNNKKLRCPYCLFDFAYFTTFRRHLSICQERKAKMESEAQENSAPRLLLIPKKDEVEESMLNLLRHQSRQSKMMKEAKTDDANDVKNFQTYTCDSCHKIFLSLFKLLQHRVVHKLQSNDEHNAASKEGPADKSQVPGEPGTPPVLFVPPLKISTPAEPATGPASAPACLQLSRPSNASRPSERSKTPPTTLRLDIPIPSTSQSGPVSAPVRLEAANPSSLVRISKFPSSSYPEREAAIKRELFPENLELRSSNELREEPEVPASDNGNDVAPDPVDCSAVKTESGLPKRKLGNASAKGPPFKRRKKIKRIVVRKHDYLSREQLQKRALKTASVKLEGDESSHPLSTEPTAADLNFPGDDVEAVSATALDTSARSSSSPVAVARRKKSKMSTSVQDRTCPHCGKRFSSVGYRKRHVLTKHTDAPAEVKVPPEEATVVARPKVLLKRKLYKKKQKRSALQRVCKAKLIPGRKAALLKLRK